MANISDCSMRISFPDEIVPLVKQPLARWVENISRYYPLYGFCYIDITPEEIINTDNLSFYADINGRWSVLSMLSPNQCLFPEKSDFKEIIRILFDNNSYFRIHFKDFEPGHEVLYESRGRMLPRIKNDGTMYLKYEEQAYIPYSFTNPNIIKVLDIDDEDYYDLKSEYYDFKEDLVDFEIIDDDKAVAAIMDNQYYDGFVLISDLVLDIGYFLEDLGCAKKIKNA